MPTPFIVKRILFSLVVGLVLGAVIGEIPFMFLRETARPPQEILLTIPKGAADQVARGEQPPSIPERMIFRVGVKLVVQNQDVVNYKLGTLWLITSSSAGLSLDREDSLAFE